VRFANTVAGYLSEIEKEAQKNSVTVNLLPLHQQCEQLKTDGTRFNRQLEDAMAKGALDSEHVRSLNDLLLRTERVLTRSEGLPNRSWYKHQIYAPGFYTGYGVKTIPGVREAVDSRNTPLARKEAQVVEECLAELSRLVQQAADTF
jgi:N-acetylated-alpha-linked acidic dipeptidase